MRGRLSLGVNAGLRIQRGGRLRFSQSPVPAAPCTSPSTLPAPSTCLAA